MKESRFVFLFCLLLYFSCAKDNEPIGPEDSTNDENTTVDTPDNTDYADWTEATHSKKAPLNYDVVFNQNEVLRFDITINSSDWEAMQADLETNLKNSGGGNQPGGGHPGGGMPGGEPSFSENTSISDYDPIFVPCNFKFNSINWYHVGIRFKGNSSLQSAYQSGNKKLSFKLDFDQVHLC